LPKIKVKKAETTRCLGGTVAASGTVEETLCGETLREVYGIDIQGFMRESLGKWVS